MSTKLQRDNDHQAAALRSDLVAHINLWRGLKTPEDHIAVALDVFAEEGFEAFERYIAQGHGLVKGDIVFITRGVRSLRQESETLPDFDAMDAYEGERYLITESSPEHVKAIPIYDEDVDHENHEPPTDADRVRFWYLEDDRLQRLSHDFELEDVTPAFFRARGHEGEELFEILRHYWDQERQMDHSDYIEHSFLDWYTETHGGELEMMHPLEGSDEPAGEYLDEGDWSKPTVFMDQEMETVQIISVDDWLEDWTNFNTVYLDNTDREDGTVLIELKGARAHEAADWRQSAGGSAFESPYDMPDYAYAVAVDYPALVDEMIREFAIVNEDNYYPPED